MSKKILKKLALLGAGVVLITGFAYSNPKYSYGHQDNQTNNRSGNYENNMNQERGHHMYDGRMHDKSDDGGTEYKGHGLMRHGHMLDKDGKHMHDEEMRDKRNDGHHMYDGGHGMMRKYFHDHHMDDRNIHHKDNWQQEK